MRNNSSISQRCNNHGTVQIPKVLEANGPTVFQLNTQIKELKQKTCKNGEIFKRIDIEQFIDILLQIEILNDCSNHVIKERNPSRTSTADSGADNEIKRIVSNLSRMSTRTDEDIKNEAKLRPVSTLSEVIKQCADKSIDAKGQPIYSFKQYPEDMPYLLLDVRSKNEFMKYHIHTAVNHPSTMLTQSSTFETRELLACRNREGTIIVLYDETETSAKKVAEALIERGYENIYLLTGGMKEAVKKFPNGLIGGDYFNPQIEDNRISDSKQSMRKSSSKLEPERPQVHFKLPQVNFNQHGSSDEGYNNNKNNASQSDDSKKFERQVRFGFSPESIEELMNQLRIYYENKISSKPSSTRQSQIGSVNSHSSRR